MKVAAIIPARMAASRFPGKPLARIAGIPMIEHVYRRCQLAEGIDSIWVATCDPEIADVVRGFGGQAIMTSDQHVRCTDRIAEAARSIACDVVINVQGDEPLLDPVSLTQVLGPFRTNPDCLASNLVQEIEDRQDIASYNVVKAVFDVRGRALYFSRLPIPNLERAPRGQKYYKQVGIIAFRKSFLDTFSHLPPTPLEKAESVDMLRALEHGYPLDLVESKSLFLGVDVPEDVPRVERALTHDKSTHRYLGAVL
jgi:3-deoxy-manno-octulosonate cytidylyltransferase (CMP-KDO synthetase)